MGGPEDVLKMLPQYSYSPTAIGKHRPGVGSKVIFSFTQFRTLTDEAVHIYYVFCSNSKLSCDVMILIKHT